MKRAYISVTNDLLTDQRIQRVATLLSDQGLKVTCIGRKRKGSGRVPLEDCRIRRHRLLVNKGPLFYACYNLRLFLHLLLAFRPALFVANDLDTLLASYLAARIRRVPLIYDSHEYFTQVPELVGRPRVQRFWERLEGRIVPRLEHCITVSPSIAEVYRKKYGVEFRVVRNMPLKQEISAKERPMEEGPGDRRKAGTQTMIYQGALNLGRGLELAIAAMKFMDGVRLVIAGTGDVEGDLHRLVETAGLAARVEFTGRLGPDELRPLTCNADLGISLEEDLGLNYRYALPNKIFDYIQCRVPVLCSDLPEMKKLVEGYGVGWSTAERDASKLADVMKDMLLQSSEGVFTRQLEKAAEELCWEKESEYYLAVLKSSV